MRTRALCCSHGPVGRLRLALPLFVRPAAGQWLQKFRGKEDAQC